MRLTLHALTLLLLPALTVVGIVFSPRRPCRSDVIWALTVSGFVTGFLATVLFPCLCSRGQERITWRQVWIPTLCANAAWLFIRASALRIALTLSSGVLLFALTYHRDAVLNTREFADSTHDIELLAKLSLHSVSKGLREVGEAKDISFPPGWLREVVDDETAWRAIRTNPTPEHQLEPLRHTWITGIYALNKLDRDFWWPGGSIARFADNVELRRRPDFRQAIETTEARRIGVIKH